MITNTDLKATQFVTITSRYKNNQVVYYGKNNIVAFSTYKRVAIPEKEDDKYAVIPPNMEFRPDLMSYKAYGIVDYWWYIMEANNLTDVYDFKPGLNIRIPLNPPL